MPRAQKKYPPELKAEAVRRHHLGHSFAKIATSLGVPKGTVQSWIATLDPGRIPQHPVAYERNVRELSTLVYDTVLVTLESIRARAVETSRPEWIARQTADQIASLDAAQWDRVIRVLSALRPAEVPPEDEGDGANEDGAATFNEPEPYRNGAVDTTG